MASLVHQLRDHDEIMIHGEGYPFLVGPYDFGPYTLTPKQLAEKLVAAGVPDLTIHIQLTSTHWAVWCLFPHDAVVDVYDACL